MSGYPNSKRRAETCARYALAWGVGVFCFFMAGLRAGPTPAFAQDLEAGSANAGEPGAANNFFEFTGRTVTNVQMFKRALLPGPNGAIVEDHFLAPIHQSLSAHAVGVDSPLGQDSLEVQIAAFGQVVPGADDAVQPATWDVSSAFIRQKWQRASLSLGRQVVAGGAARYARFDGGSLALGSRFGLQLQVYGGLTAMPRWNQRYGYHQLGQSYEDWSTNPDARLRIDRNDYWLAGVRAGWERPDIGSVHVSVHHQQEHDGPAQANMGFSGTLTKIQHLELSADALFSSEASRFSDLRLAALVDAIRSDDAGLFVRAEVLHTVPSLLLSQASVLSVFSFEEITEAGGMLSAQLPHRVQVDASAYGQMYQEGSPGMRAELSAQFRLDDKDSFFARAELGRLDTSDNGYWMLRASLGCRLPYDMKALGDAYFYRYDDEISGYRWSSFYAAHLAYQPDAAWNARIGGSLTTSPYASFDLQALARVEYQFERSRR
jgi:hypothetical protein